MNTTMNTTIALKDDSDDKKRLDNCQLNETDECTVFGVFDTLSIAKEFVNQKGQP